MPSLLDDAAKGIGIRPVYRDDSVALFHADCETVLSKIKPCRGITVISDPPYGIKWCHFNNPVPILGDDRPFDPSHLLAHRCVLFGGQHYHTRLPEKGSWVIWDKRCPHCGGKDACKVGPCHTNDIGDFEDIWCSFRTHRTIYRHYWNGWGKASEKGVKRIHPTQKPVMLMGFLISDFTSPGDLIVDPYAGSCSTLLAARACGRYAVGIELDRRYIAPAIKRLKEEAK